MVLSVDHPKVGPMQVLGVPVKLASNPGGVRTPPPTLGQHTERILEELGYDAAARGALAEAKVI